ncbi:MAG: hypothetical protein KAT28_00135 [Candidatus Aenigmarchaeota archaeon]|nr:hypothetical protein [Candidatus Aenigmarchaeota archaeon]
METKESFIVKCPYRGCFIDLANLDDNHLKSDEYRCPNCDEWVWTEFTWREPFRQQPYPENSGHIKHPEKYQCLVDAGKCYDKDLNEASWDIV